MASQLGWQQGLGSHRQAGGSSGTWGSGGGEPVRPRVAEYATRSAWQGGGYGPLSKMLYGSSSACARLSRTMACNAAS